MDRNKIIIIVVLALIIVAYVVFVVRGSMTHEKSDKSERKSSAKSYKPSGGMNNFGSVMGSWLGRFLPKPDIPCAKLPAQGSELSCDGLSIGSGIKIPEKKGTSFRIATLVLQDGKASVEYDDDSDAADNADMDDQDFNLPDMENDGARQSTIVIFEDGGKLTISCKDNTNCRVGLK